MAETHTTGTDGTSFLPEGQLRQFALSGEANVTAANARVAASNRMDETRLWMPIEDASDEELSAGLRSPRPINPFKSVLLPSRELVALYGKPGLTGPLAALAEQTVTLLGMRGSDCRALAYLDMVMLGDPTPDPFYQARRERCTVISVDCVEPCESCFCNLLGRKAYAESGYDVNLSPVEGGYVVTAGSEKGTDLLRRNESRLSAAGAIRLDQVDCMRAETADRLAEQNAEFAPASAPELAELLPGSLSGAFWSEELARCVQCGGCTSVCPTCYCFLLHDLDAGPHEFQRVRLADSCQFTGYSTMAGPPGGMKPDPRRTHMDKFQRRFAHKFWHDVTVNGVLGCVGCGRCLETCPGSIDLRRVITSVRSAQVADG